MAVPSLVELPSAAGAAIDDPAGDATGPKEAFGVIAVGDLLFGIPIDALREVVPAPETYLALPEAGADLLGAIVLRGKTIPVYSIRAQFGLSDTRAGTVIVIVQSSGGILGVLVDRVVELVRGGTTRRQPVRRDPSERIGNRCLTADDRLITLLNIDRLFAVPGVAKDDGTDRPPPAERSIHVPHLRFVAGGLRFMAPLTEIAATIPRDAVLPSAVAGGLCLGVIRRHGVEMAILDTGAAFGFAPTARHVQSAAGIALDFGGGGSLAFRVDAVRDILRIDPGRVVPIPPVVTGRAHLMSGAYLDPDGHHNFVLDIAACRQDESFANLAAVAHRVEPRGDTKNPREGARAADRSVFLIVEAGGRIAVAIDEVVEVIRVPQNLRADPASGQIANLAHRNSLMPVFDLATWLGEETPEITRESAILVVARGEHLYGWVVSRLVSIDAGVPWSDGPDTDGDTNRSETAYAQFGSAADGKLVSVVNLRDLLDG